MFHLFIGIHHSNNPGIMAKGKKSQGPPGKNMMAGPKLFVWPSFPEDTRSSTLRQLSNTFDKIKFAKPDCPWKRTGNKKKKREGETSGGDKSEQQQPQQQQQQRQQQPSTSWSTHRQFLFFGINQTTRGLEKASLSLLIVDESCSPACLTDHLRFLAALHFVPIIRIPGLTETLAPIVKIKSVSALGFSKLLPKNEELGILVNNLLVRAKKVKIPWTYYGLEECREGSPNVGAVERKENDAPDAAAVERKDDDVAMADVVSAVDEGTKNNAPAADLVNYETVVVKKITPNPDKVKKKKKKKKNNDKSQ